jgi:hypothetical protein
MIIRYSGYLFLLVFAVACKKGDKVPGFLEIPAVTVVSGNTTVTSRITDVWVYADEELLGAWELPARVPVLRNGSTTIQIAPAVKRNGMYDDRVRYPFYTWWTGTVDLVPEERMQLQPQVTYTAFADQWLEDFSDAGIQLMVSDDSDTTFQRFTSTNHPDLQLLNGSPAGGFVVDPERPYMRVFTDEDFSAPGGPVFLELDYSTNVVLTVGVMYTANGQPSRQPYVYLVPTVSGDGIQPGWNKVYIDLSPIFNLALSQRDIFFEAQAPGGGIGRVYLDNIKLVRSIP